jgi:hypothetical protein
MIAGSEVQNSESRRVVPALQPAPRAPGLVRHLPHRSHYLSLIRFSAMALTAPKAVSGPGQAAH